jgi:hypothetical protein
MLLAKLALGLGGVVLVAGTYTFHEGIMRVDADHYDGRHVHVWIPAAIVPMVLHLVPSRHFDEHSMAEAAAWLPTLHALTRELKKYPESELVEVDRGSEHVRIRTHQGKLLIDVTKPDETVHVACPLAMMEDIAGQLETRAPGV